MLYQLSTIELPPFQSSYVALNCRRCAPASECSLLRCNLGSLAQLVTKLQRGLQNFLDDSRIPKTSIVRMSIFQKVCISFSGQESMI